MIDSAKCDYNHMQATYVKDLNRRERHNLPLQAQSKEDDSSLTKARRHCEIAAIWLV